LAERDAGAHACERLVCLLVVMAGVTAQQAFLDVAMVVALISFVGTVAYARYIEREGS
jgi:multisubunit Na+/H+ antiporter MnhF subunit